MTTNKPLIYCFILLASVFGLQCKTVHNPSSKKAMFKSIYIDNFKLTYFRQLLIKSYNNSKAAQEIISQDHSLFTEPILTMDDYKLIDSLTTVDDKQMQIDSVTRIGRVAEGSEGKRQLSFILNRYESKWLDNLAKKRYKSAGINEMYSN